MDNLLPTNEFTEVEGRQYINPQVSLDESTSFIDNLRAVQNQQNQEIAKQTNMLGTDVPSIEGGLIGPESYFASRYQIPQTNASVSNLRATAQAAALNQILQNEQAIWKKRYQDAYRSYQKKTYNKAYGGKSGGSGGNTGNTSTWNGGITKTPTNNGGASKTDGTSKTTTENTNKTSTPPNPEEYYIDGGEQTKRIQERSGLPDWLINTMKIFG